MAKLSEKKWMEKYLHGRTWSWDELLRSGRVPTDDLEDGDLKTLIDQFLNVDVRLEKYLKALGYEAG